MGKPCRLNKVYGRITAGQAAEMGNALLAYHIAEPSWLGHRNSAAIPEHPAKMAGLLISEEFL